MSRVGQEAQVHHRIETTMRVMDVNCIHTKRTCVSVLIDEFDYHRCSRQLGRSPCQKLKRTLSNGPPLQLNNLINQLRQSKVHSAACWNELVRRDRVFIYCYTRTSSKASDGDKWRPKTIWRFLTSSKLLRAQEYGT